MRVFDCYAFNIIDKVKFKDSRTYIEELLSDLNLSYQNISFSLASGKEDLVDKVVEKYPNLAKYRHYYEPFNKDILTSYSPDWMKGDIYAQKEDWEDIFEIFSKIPRGYHFGMPTLVLDGIDWYGNGNLEPSIKPEPTFQDLAVIHDNRIIAGNQIVIDRGYDSSNKYNMIYVKIEATSDGVPRDTEDIIRNMELQLGKPEWKTRSCRYTEEEYVKLNEQTQICNKLLRDRMEEFYPYKKYTFSMYTPYVPNLVDKKKLKEAFKDTGFEFTEGRKALPGTNELVCVDQHNFLYRVMFDRTQSAPDYFYVYLFINGCNFYVSQDQKMFVASTEEDAAELLKKIAGFCVRMREEFGKTLAETFGETPEWYTY